MRYSLKIKTMICAAALTSACQTTTPPSNQMHADARQHIKKMDSVLISPQYKVDANIKTSKVSSFLPIHIAPILFDIGVNSVREHQANTFIKPIHETLDDYDYTYDIREEFNAALDSSGVEGAGDLKIVRHERPGLRMSMIRRSQADAVMFVDVKYAFSPKFDTLDLTSSIFVYPINPELDPYKELPDTDGVIEYSDNIYRNQFTARVPVAKLEEGVPERSKSENAALWAAMSEEELKGKLQQAASFLGGHIASDMNVDREEKIDIEPRPAEPQDDHDEYLSKKPILVDASF